MEDEEPCKNSNKPKTSFKFYLRSFTVKNNVNLDLLSKEDERLNKVLYIY
jgi:hypothetical protein